MTQPPLDPPHDCAEDGHNWQRSGQAPDGTEFCKCRECGLEDEQP